jgi:TolB-like protein/Tfp pilus assembly protein PilF
VTPDGSVKVLDFGVAKAASTLTSVSTDASTGEPQTAAPLSAVVKPGTPGYMSPEHLLGHPPDERSDIYSLGVVLFEMATGRRPYPQTTVADLVIALVAGPPRADTLNPGLPRPLIDIIDKALQHDPNKRFQSASEIESALAALDTPATPPDPAALARRRRLTAVLAIVGVIAVVAIPYLVVHGRPRLARPTLVKAIHSVAVLPLVNLSGQPEQDYFVDGMTEGLINALGRVSALKVTARTSVMPFRKTTKSLAEIAAALEVDALIEGSATIAPGPGGTERVRVTVNLIDPASQKQVWNDTIERDLNDVLSIQSEIARALADDINVAVTPDERVRLTARQMVNPHAYKLFLLGRQQWNNRTQPALTRALDYFKQAIAVESDYAPAHAGLADTYVLLAGDFGAIARDVGAREATASASRAIALDPGLGEAYASLAFTNFFLKWDWVRAEEQFKQALRLSPNYATAHQWYGNYLSDMGREEEGLREMRRALELDPLSAIISRDVAWPLFFSRRYDEAIQQLKLTLAQHAGYLPAERLLARAYAQKGDFREALPRFEAMKAKDDTSRTRCELAWAYARAKRDEDASRLLKTVYDARSTAPYPYDLALIFSAQNRLDDAFDALNRAFEQRDPTMVNLKHDPRFDALRADPRYVRLLALMRFPD